MQATRIHTYGYKHIAAIIVLLCIAVNVYGQSQAKSKVSERYEVDAKRMGTDINSEDALPRSREFKRIDSTYYVGWMFEGAYKYNHAADYLGFKNATAPLLHALNLLERDYKKELTTRTSDLMVYYYNYKYQIDYTMTALYLMNCYSNMEDAGEVYKLLRRVIRMNFQRDYYMDSYNYLGWLIHRNRYYTNTKYPFLKNSIDENEALANRYLDSGLRRIEINKKVNTGIFQPGYEQQERLSVYHYKAILYSYALNVDSATYYYELMRKSNIFPHNNYASFRSVCGDFREAEKEYKEAVTQDAGDKRLKEWAYYLSILDIYKGKPKTGAELAKDMIKANGSTPGFGWYNIALARCLAYDGQMAEAERYANKAADFKELHIGTTLGQAHYDFSIQLIKLLNKQSAVERQMFENKNWWYNPAVLARMAQLQGEKYMQQFLIINQFAQNPERDRVIYKLFSTESTVSWDEVWYLIRDFSTRFFLDKFKKEAQKDDRKYIHKYFRYFIARLEMKMGNYTEARRILDEVLRSPDMDVEYEQLLIARVLQAQAECAQERKDVTAYNDWLYKLYITYPQLIPGSGLKMNMNLHVSGAPDEVALNRLKACNINWTTNSSIPFADAYVIFSGSGNKKRAEYYVMDKSGQYIVDRQSFGYTRSEQAGTDLAYRLFNIGGKIPERGKEDDL